MSWKKNIICLPKVSPWKNSSSRIFFFVFVNRVNKIVFFFQVKRSQSASHTGNMFLWEILIWHENKKKYSPGKKMKFTHFHQHSSHKQNYLDLTWKKITLEKMYVTAPQDFQDVIIAVKTSCCFFLSEHFDDKFVISLLKKLHCNITDWFHLIPLMINSLKHGCSSHFNTFECL